MHFFFNKINRFVRLVALIDRFVISYTIKADRLLIRMQHKILTITVEPHSDPQNFTPLVEEFLKDINAKDGFLNLFSQSTALAISLNNTSAAMSETIPVQNGLMRKSPEQQLFAVPVGEGGGEKIMLSYMGTKKN